MSARGALYHGVPIVVAVVLASTNDRAPLQAIEEDSLRITIEAGTPNAHAYLDHDPNADDPIRVVPWEATHENADPADLVSIYSKISIVIRNETDALIRVSPREYEAAVLSVAFWDEEGNLWTFRQRARVTPGVKPADVIVINAQDEVRCDVLQGMFVLSRMDSVLNKHASSWLPYPQALEYIGHGHIRVYKGGSNESQLIRLEGVGRLRLDNGEFRMLGAG